MHGRKTKPNTVGTIRAGGKIRSGPLVSKVAYVTPAVLGIPTAAKRWGKSEFAHLWAKWLRHPCRLGDRAERGREIRSGPLVGKLATSALPSRGSPPLQKGGGGAGDHKWPTCGQSGYVTPALSGIPTASERGGGGGDQKWPTCGQSGYVTPAVSGIPTAVEPGGGGVKSEVAHLWARWLRPPCRLGDPHGCRAGGGGDQKWPTCGQSGNVTPAILGIPTAAEREAE